MNRNNKHTELEMVDRIKGSLMAGAAGDALGYAVEFYDIQTIFEKYGCKGITKFELDGEKALVSDDTQMTLFTANGLLVGNTHRCRLNVGIAPERYVKDAYMDWYYTQTSSRRKPIGDATTWLRSLPQMHHRRAPGNTCMMACMGMLYDINEKNDSKGCGGIMRVAPVALFAASLAANGKPLYTIKQLAEVAGYTSYLTHNHPLGFLPSAMMAVLIYKIMFLPTEEVKHNIEALVRETLALLDSIYEGKYEEEKKYLKELTEKAIELTKSNLSDVEALQRIGRGWVAEETWAMAVYCVIKHIHSVEDAIIASVNVTGDSDSIGSVVGNIMGAIYGYEHIKSRNIFCPEGCELEQTLELSDIILALAGDLAIGYVAENEPEGKQWHERYIQALPSGI